MKRSLPTSETPPPFSSSTGATTTYHATTANNHHHHTSYFSNPPNNNNNTIMPIGEESHQTLSSQNNTFSFPHSSSSTSESQSQQQEQPFRPHSSLYFTSTPNHHHHHNYSNMTPSSSSSSLDSTHNFLDCQSINHSLKRVKISTSPGELRLNKDLSDMLLHQSSPPNNSSSWKSSTTHKNEYISKNNRAKLERDVVDPLRLKLSVLVQVMEQEEKVWVFLIQVPRMYPHSPPVVYRVSVLPCDAVSGGGGGGQNVAAVVSLSNGQKSVFPPLLESVLVLSQSPPGGGGDDCSKDEQEEEEVLGSVETYKNWSPISRLVDLIDFLINIPLTRRRKWEEYIKHPQQKIVKPKKEEKVLKRQITNEFDLLQEEDEAEECKKENVDVQSRQYLQQQQDQSFGTALVPNNNNPFMSSSKHSLALSQCQYNNNNVNDNATKMKSTTCQMESGEKSGEYSSKEILMQEEEEDEFDNHSTKQQAPVALGAKKHLFLNPNRFDVGYDTRYIPPIPAATNSRMVSCTMEEEEVEDDMVWDDDQRKKEWRVQQLSPDRVVFGGGQQFVGENGGQQFVGENGGNGRDWGYRQSSVDTQMMME